MDPFQNNTLYLNPRVQLSNLFIPYSVTVSPFQNPRIINNPTVIYSWWCTTSAAVIILFRVSGRLIRNGLLFREDKIMAFSLIPLFARMVCIHFVLIFGSNNILVPYTFPNSSSSLFLPPSQMLIMNDEQAQKRIIGSILVLPARIFFAMFIWTAKLSIAEFLRRLTASMWNRSYDIVLRTIRLILLVTILLVISAILLNCLPFSLHYALRPFPAPKCQHGLRQSVVMGICDIFTDVLLVVFPIPIIMLTSTSPRRKLGLISLFSLSVILIIASITRMVSVTRHRGNQQYRTVWASSEILVSAAVSNCIVLGSFIRNRGIKKPKFKVSSVVLAETEQNGFNRVDKSLRKWGSDEDLIRAVGGRVTDSTIARSGIWQNTFDYRDPMHRSTRYLDNVEISDLEMANIERSENRNTLHHDDKNDTNFF